MKTRRSKEWREYSRMGRYGGLTLHIVPRDGRGNGWELSGRVQNWEIHVEVRG